jgi:hypothetical protein
MTEEDKKRIQLETLQKLKDLAGEYSIHYSSEILFFLQLMMH